MAKFQLLVKDVLHRPVVLAESFPDGAKCCFTSIAVGFFQDSSHERDGASLSVELDGHGTDYLVVLGVQLCFLGLQWDICLAEQLNAIANRFDPCPELFGGK